MYKEFTEPKLLTEQEIIANYPNSKYLLKNIEDVNNIKGYLVAVSTDKDSYKKICEEREKLAEAGEDVTLCGTYNGFSFGIVNRVDEGKYV